MVLFIYWAKTLISSSTTKPFLRWAGSKRKLIPEILSLINCDFDRYVEPFMGSASLYFAIEPKQALLSDTNECLVNSFQVMKQHPRRLYNTIMALPEGEEEYYRIRTEYSKKLSKIKRAAYFIYLNRYCFNGLYRTNLSGKFNVPYGGGKTGKVPEYERFLIASKQLQNTELRKECYLSVLEVCKKGDLVYLDPPYIVPDQRVFNEYGPKSFSWIDLIALKEKLIDLDKNNIKFILSYASSDEVLNLFSDWNISHVNVYRTMNSKAHKREHAKEIFVTNIKQ